VEFVHGFQRALLVAAGIAFTAAIVGVATLRKPEQVDEPALELAA
jgi:hypothetical protein